MDNRDCRPLSPLSVRDRQDRLPNLPLGAGPTGVVDAEDNAFPEAQRPTVLSGWVNQPGKNSPQNCL
jgi:hypothetical protein